MEKKYEETILDLLNQGLNDWQIKKKLFMKIGIYLTNTELKRIKKRTTKIPVVLNKELLIQTFCADFFHPDNSIAGISSIVAMVLRDNKVTEVERRFIHQKALELGLATSMIESLDTYIHHNNPYYDGIIELIWGDGVVSNDEIEFLKEKCEENHFSTSQLNKRFWQYSIKYHLDHLTNYPSFFNFYKAFCYTHKKLGGITNWDPEQFFQTLNLLEQNSFDEVMDKLQDFSERLFTNYFPDLIIDSLISSDLIESENSILNEDTLSNKHYEIVNEEPKKESIELNEEYKEVIKAYQTNPFQAFDLFKKIEETSNPKISRKALKESFDELISVIS